LALLVIKWALITAAILAVPFGVWWIYDHTMAGDVTDGVTTSWQQWRGGGRRSRAGRMST
jgi:hypothetical protein